MHVHVMSAYPQKRTLGFSREMSALCQEQRSAAALDHLLSKGHVMRAVLCPTLTNTQALLTRLEAGVHVPRSEQREVVRLLYVATRHQVEALADCYSGRVGLQSKSHSVVCTLPLG